MVNYFFNLSPIIQALIATIFTWSITALGASLVFIFKKFNKTILDIMLSISAGIMLASSIFSLIIPSIEMSENLHLNKIFMTILGIILGSILLLISDYFFNKLKKNNTYKRSIMLISSITIHNIPEGMAVGVAFGSVMYHLEGASIISAIMLAIGIAIQNFPEGLAVSLPLKREGMSNIKAFFYGQLSGLVEPISGVIGSLLVLKMRYLLPLLLSFAAGAMLYVVIEELIPESQKNKYKNIMTFSTILGFCIMMILDILLS